MTGKKKNMEGGIIGMNNKNYSSIIINDLAKRIISGKTGNITWLDRQRAEQRINSFLKKLRSEVEKVINHDRIETLYKYFYAIVILFPKEIRIVLEKEYIIGKNNKGQYSGDLFTVYNFFINKDKEYKKLESLEPFKIKKPKTNNNSELSNSGPSHSLRNQGQQNNSKKQKLIVDNNTLYEKLINEFNEWYEREFIQNLKVNTIKIKLSNKNKLISYITDLAKRIHFLGLHYILPNYQDENKLITLREKLGILKELYEFVISKQYIQNQETSLYNQSNINKIKNILNQKFKNLNPLNQ